MLCSVVLIPGLVAGWAVIDDGALAFEVDESMSIIADGTLDVTSECLVCAIREDPI